MDFDNNEQVKNFVKREFNVKSGRDTFFVLTLDSPEKWKLAKDLHTTYDLELSEGKIMRIKLNGISLKEWEKIEEENIIPSERDNASDQAKEEIRKAIEKAEASKKVLYFELATGKTVPGDDIEQKRSFLADRCAGQIEGLYSYITTSLINLVDGRLVDEYFQATIEQEDERRVIEFDDFNSWSIASETKISFIMCRPYEDYIIEVPLKGISESKKRQIEEATEKPKPPMIPSRKKDGKGFDTSRLEPNFNDPMWRQASRAAAQKETAMLFDECLVFDIPGNNLKEKYDWISLHLVGDIIRIKNYIESRILSYEGSVDFFGRNFYQSSW